MRYFFFFSLMLFSKISLSQVAENMKLEGKQVVFEKIYHFDSLVVNNVEMLLTLNIPKVQDLTNFTKTTEIIIAKISNASIDYKKYGGKWANTLNYLNFPFYCDVSIVWKDQKYRVTLSNMYFSGNPIGAVKASDIFTNMKGTEFNSSKIVKSGLYYLDRYLSDLFKINTSSKESW